MDVDVDESRSSAARSKVRSSFPCTCCCRLKHFPHSHCSALFLNHVYVWKLSKSGTRQKYLGRGGGIGGTLDDQFSPLSLARSLSVCLSFFSLRGNPDLTSLVGQSGVNSLCFYIYNCTEIKAVLENNTEVFPKLYVKLAVEPHHHPNEKTRPCGSYRGRSFSLAWGCTWSYYAAKMGEVLLDLETNPPEFKKKKSLLTATRRLIRASKGTITALFWGQLSSCWPLLLNSDLNTNIHSVASLLGIPAEEMINCQHGIHRFNKEWNTLLENEQRKGWCDGGANTKSDVSGPTRKWILFL